MKTHDRAILVCQALGINKTVDGLCKELNLDVNQFLFADMADNHGNNDFSRGWFAIRTCSKENFLSKLKEANKGNLQYWFGVASGQELLNRGL